MISTATTTSQSVTTLRQHSSHGQYAGKPAKVWSCGIAKQNGWRLNNWIRCCLLHSFKAKWSILIWSTAPSCQDKKVVTSPNAIILSNSWKVKSNRFHSRISARPSLMVLLKTIDSSKCKGMLRICTSLWFCTSFAGCLAFEVSRLFGEAQNWRPQCCSVIFSCRKDTLHLQWENAEVTCKNGVAPIQGKEVVAPSQFMLLN